MLSLDLPVRDRMCTLNECIDDYACAAPIDRWVSEGGNVHRALRQCRFWCLPLTLVICLKRWTATGRYNKNRVVFPVDLLDARRYVIGYDRGCYEYTLLGVCYHSGAVAGGHYWAAVRSGGVWYTCNDARVTRVDVPPSDHAYCLFYQKK